MKLLKTSNNPQEFLKNNGKGMIQFSCDDFRNTIPLIKDNSLDLILTDPPYNLGNFARTRNRHIHSMNRSNFVLDGWDNSSSKEFDKLMEDFFALSSQKLKVGGTMLMFCSFMKIGSLIEIAQKYKFYYKTSGVWHKTNPMPRNMNLQFVPSNEAWLYFINQAKTGTFNNEGKLILDYIETSVVPVSEKKIGSHPTQKPEKLMEYFVKLLSNEGDFVCDPFMGSGTVAVVCNNLSRNFIGVEINKDYFNIAKKRMEAE